MAAIQPRINAERARRIKCAVVRVHANVLCRFDGGEPVAVIFRRKPKDGFLEGLASGYSAFVRFPIASAPGVQQESVLQIEGEGCFVVTEPVMVAADGWVTAQLREAEQAQHAGDTNG